MLTPPSTAPPRLGLTKGPQGGSRSVRRHVDSKVRAVRGQASSHTRWKDTSQMSRWNNLVSVTSNYWSSRISYAWNLTYMPEKLPPEPREGLPS